MDSTGNIWNRVILLIAGFIIGWNLSNYWTVAQSEMTRQRYRLLLGVALGLIMLIWLGVESPISAIYGLFIIMLTAFVAYTGSAREASGTPEPLPRPRPARRKGLCDEVLVVLAGHGETDTYDGPDVWARYLSWLREQGESVSSWFVRPRVYARIRQAVDRMEKGTSLDAWVTGLQTELGGALGVGFHCIKGYAFVRPGLASTLSHAAEDGYTRCIVVPVGAIDREDISRAVTASRIKEVGVQVVVMQPEASFGWDKPYVLERLQRLMRGELYPVPATEPRECAVKVARLVQVEVDRRRWTLET